MAFPCFCSLLGRGLLSQEEWGLLGSSVFLLVAWWGLLYQEERGLLGHCAARKDVAEPLTIQFVVQVSGPSAAGAQVQCRLLAACIRGAVDGLTSTPFLYYKRLNGTVQVQSHFD